MLIGADDFSETSGHMCNSVHTSSANDTGSSSLFELFTLSPCVTFTNVSSTSCHHDAILFRLQIDEMESGWQNGLSLVCGLGHV